MFWFLLSWFIGQHRQKICCTKTPTFPNTGISINSGIYTVVVRFHGSYVKTKMTKSYKNYMSLTQIYHDSTEFPGSSNFFAIQSSNFGVAVNCWTLDRIADDHSSRTASLSAGRNGRRRRLAAMGTMFEEIVGLIKIYCRIVPSMWCAAPFAKVKGKVTIICVSCISCVTCCYYQLCKMLLLSAV